MEYTKKLADFCAGVSYGTLPKEVVHKAKLCVLDYIANIYGSLELEAVKNTAAYFRSLGGPRQATPWAAASRPVCTTRPSSTAPPPRPSRPRTASASAGTTPARRCSRPLFRSPSCTAATGRGSSRRSWRATRPRAGRQPPCTRITPCPGSFPPERVGPSAPPRPRPGS